MTTENYYPVFYNQTFDRPPVPEHSKAVFIGCRIFETTRSPLFFQEGNHWSAIASVFCGLTRKEFEAKHQHRLLVTDQGDGESVFFNCVSLENNITQET